MPPPPLEDHRKTFSPDAAIDEQIEDLERWASANLRREMVDRIRFWVLRGAAFIGAAGAAITGGIGNGQAALGLGVIAAFAIAIDSAWPYSGLRGARQRAVHELRELENSIKLRWGKVRLAFPEAMSSERVAHAIDLLESVQTRRDEIARYSGQAEPSPRANQGF